jgi:4-hydroxybenzoate polyprenyltransferase
VVESNTAHIRRIPEIPPETQFRRRRVDSASGFQYGPFMPGACTPRNSTRSTLLIPFHHGVAWSALGQLIRLPNQTGTLLLMLPTLWSLLLASEGRPPLWLIVIFALGAFLMRSAGVIMNDLADRSLDRQVTRTRMRPLASGMLGVPEAMTVLVLLLAVAAGLLLLLNPFTLALSPMAVLLAAVYPFSKRVVPVPQAVLGMAFGWGVIMAWAAVQNRLTATAWFLYGATICWTVGYDSIYALQDREDDARAGIHSLPIFFGSRVWVAIGGSLALMLLLLGWAGWLMALGIGFYGVLTGVAGLFARQVWRVRRPVAPAEAFALFKQHVWVGWAILGGIWIGSFTLQ